MRGFCLEVTGDFACFTRPEMKVERVSYDVITPSAVRAVFSAIFWKPAIRWRPTRIEVLSPIRWVNIRRNEVSDVASARSQGLLIEDKRQQRAGLFLRDVRYRLSAEFDFIPPEQRPRAVNPAPDWLADGEERALLAQVDAARNDEKPAKYAAMFERRARKGQYFMHPYLGCREFSCRTIRLITHPELEPPPIDETRDLGFMLYDLDYTNPNAPQPMFFRAQMVRGVVRIPAPTSEEIVR